MHIWQFLMHIFRSPADYKIILKKMSTKAETMLARMKLLLSSGGNCADVQFLVGEEGTEKELLQGHKLILTISSDIFEAMFRFDTANADYRQTKLASSAEIYTVDVIDVEAGAFKAMLSFIYSDDLSGLNGDNAMAVLKAAKKYLITGLIKECLAFPISKLRNVFLAMVQARLLDENDFARRCLAYIDQNIASLIQSEAFLQIEQNLLCEILDRDQLKTVGEITIWNAAIRWADAQCRKKGKECSAANRRAMLGPALYKLRVPDDIIELFCRFDE